MNRSQRVVADFDEFQISLMISCAGMGWQFSTHLGSLRLDFASAGEGAVDFSHDCGVLVAVVGKCREEIGAWCDGMIVRWNRKSFLRRARMSRSNLEGGCESRGEYLGGDESTKRFPTNHGDLTFEDHESQMFTPMTFFLCCGYRTVCRWYPCPIFRDLS